MKPVFFETPAEFRDWLERNHDSADELDMGLHKKASGKPSITLREAQDEGLCFGWIDSVAHGLNESSYTIRFTPRKPKSVWSAVNIERAEELIAAGRMTPAGLAAFEARDEKRVRHYSHERENVAFDAARGDLPGKRGRVGVLPSTAAGLPAGADVVGDEREERGDARQTARGTD